MSQRLVRLGRPARLPSIESQTIAFLDWGRKQRGQMSHWLKWDVVWVYLRYSRGDFLPEPWHEAEILVIATV